MLVDEQQEVREKAINLIISARNTMEDDVPRRFVKPTREQIDENANQYWEILRLDKIIGNISSSFFFGLRMSLNYRFETVTEFFSSFHCYISLQNPEKSTVIKG